MIIHPAVPRQTLDWLTERASRMPAAGLGHQAEVELVLWRRVLAAELAEVGLTVEQVAVLVGLLRGAPLDPTVVGRTAFALVGDPLRAVYRGTPRRAPQSVIDARIGTDVPRLLAVLQGLGPAADHALRDAVSRLVASGAEPTEGALVEVGFRFDAENETA